MKGPLFILAGNGPYDNRGCEAIVRGTVEILRRHFDRPQFLVCSQFDSDEDCRAQQRQETDPDIRHVRMRALPALPGRIANKVLWKFYLAFPDLRQRYIFGQMLRDLEKAEAVLSVGGDNYSMDYGALLNFMDLDDLAIKRRKKLVIWCASVGPFEGREKDMSAHLNKVTAILARESKTMAYLESIGVVANVHRTCDPALWMDGRRPNDIDLGPPGAIGINLHPLMANFVCNGDLDLWRQVCTKALKAVLENCEAPLLLIPHVSSRSEGVDDGCFLAGLEKDLASDRVRRISTPLDAAETKWVISQCRAFIGARTHSTIAAFSSGVPTIFVGYSQKAEGINQDLYGHTDFCLRGSDFGPEALVTMLGRLLERETEIRRDFAQRVPAMKGAALESGRLLKRICQG